jgi:RecA-family ATPase
MTRPVLEFIPAEGRPLSGVPSPEKRGWGVLTLTANELADRPLTPRVFNVPGVIPNSTVTSLGGDGGTGKSTLALQLAVATSAKRQWLGRDVLQGRTLYLSAEDDIAEMHRRLSDMCVHYDIGLEDLAGLKIIPLADEDALLAVGEAHGRPLTPTRLYEELQGLVAEWEPVLIVIDSAADVFGGNENDRAQVRQFIGMLRKLAMTSGAAVVLLTHPSVSGLSSGSGTSGSTAWSNSVRSRLSLTKPTYEGADPDLRVLTTMKANYVAAGGEVRMRRGAGVFVVEGVVSLSAMGSSAARDEIDRKFLTILADHAAQGRPPSPNLAPSTFARDPLAGGTTASGFRAAMDRLFRQGSIRIDLVGPPSRVVQRLVLAVPA